MAESLFGSPVRELAARAGTADADPGSGALAGVTLALSAAVLAGAARASVGTWSSASAAAAQADALRIRAERLAGEDMRAYRDARRALSSPLDATPLAAALERAAAVPLELAGAACDVAVLAVEVVRRGEPERRDDVAAAAHLAAGVAAAA